LNWRGRAEAHLLTIDNEDDAVERRRLRLQFQLVAWNNHLDAPAAELERSGDREETALAAVLGEQDVTAARRLRRVDRQDDWNAVERQHLVTVHLAHTWIDRHTDR